MCLSWLAAELSWLPILVGLLLLCSILIPYCIAVKLGHVIAGLPFISDTGAMPPESCVFGQLLNMTAAAALACIFIRFKQVGIAAEGNNSVSLMNRVGFVLGIIACFGMSLVANFQELNVASVHMIGAMMCFGVGSIYTILHTWISFKLRNRGSITCLRLFLSVSCFFLFIITMVYTSKALKMHAGLNPLIWHDTDDGFVLHQVATSSEWLLAISFLVYFWTFIPDFRWMTVAVEVQHAYLRIPGVNMATDELPSTI